MEIGAYEAKTHLSRLLDEVADGRRFTITKHGVPVAILQPVRPGRHMGSGEAIAALRQFREGIVLGQPGLRQLLDEGRR